jgi:cystathionine beta-lyase/cystathionine gamma-synthase
MTAPRDPDSTPRGPRLGIWPGLFRVSVGLEDVEDLVADFDRALGVAREVAAVVPTLVDA